LVFGHFDPQRRHIKHLSFLISGHAHVNQ
jgi:hypothetical protein